MSNSFCESMDCQVPLSMGFPRQEYWSGLLFPSLEGIPDPGMEPMSPALADRFFTTEPPQKSFKTLENHIYKNNVYFYHNKSM